PLNPYWRTATTATQALAPLTSWALIITVVLPCGTGMPVATQVSVPQAVPVAPLEVCQVMEVMPAPPEALPLTVIVELFTVTTGAIGEAIEIVTGDVAVAFA